MTQLYLTVTLPQAAMPHHRQTSLGLTDALLCCTMPLPNVTTLCHCRTKLCLAMPRHCGASRTLPSHCHTGLCHCRTLLCLAVARHQCAKQDRYHAELCQAMPSRHKAELRHCRT